MEGVTMIAMPLDLCPSPLAVELALLLCSEVVVAKQFLNVGVEDVTPETFSVNACTSIETFKSVCLTKLVHLVQNPGPVELSSLSC